MRAQALLFALLMRDRASAHHEKAKPGEARQGEGGSHQASTHRSRRVTTQRGPAGPDEIPDPRAQALAAGRPWAKVAPSRTRDLAGTRRANILRIAAITILVGGLALLLRVWALGALGLNSDEAVYAGQGASLTRDPAFLPYFPVFRAHPLLFQTLQSLEYRIFGVSPLGGRLLAVAFGMATVWLTYAIGSRLYGRRVGVLAALLIGLMPYTVVVDRQILLDGPMTFFTGLALYLLIRFVQTDRTTW